MSEREGERARERERRRENLMVMRDDEGVRALSLSLRELHREAAVSDRPRWQAHRVAARAHTHTHTHTHCKFTHVH